MSMRHHLLKILSTISIAATILPLLAACGNPAAIAAQIGSRKLTICHANGNTTKPYDEVTLSLNELIAHADHRNDIVPAPQGGCPKTVQAGSNNGQIAICHATDSTTAPYSKITVDINGLLGHIGHQNDIIPAPPSGCPAVLQALATAVTGTPAVSTATSTLTVTPTLAVTTTATVTGTPGGTVTPAATNAENEGGAMITICHATGSSKNHYVMITINVNGLNGHRKHASDIIPAPAGGCPR